MVDTTAKATDADHYIDGKSVLDTSEVGAVDSDFDLSCRQPLAVSREGLRQASDIEDAILLSSEVREGKHKPVIDIDVPIRVVPSSTPGHSHLYVDVEMTWEEYAALLKALEVAGLVETGYVLASLDREATHVRLPWVKKKESADA